MADIRRGRARATWLAAVLLSTVAIAPLSAQDVQQNEEEKAQNLVVVTGTRIRQGGAQDIQHFRSMAIEASTLPRPESLTVEGLMGEHDLTLPAAGPCDKLFCLNVQATAANLPTRPDDKLFVGLAFDSNVDADKLKRGPVSLMAVVDRSGSMGGPPMENVKAALHALVDQLGPKDRLGIVIYGNDSKVHLQPTAANGDKRLLHDAIDAIAILGSTYMEAGLKLGYDAAFREAKSFDGSVRMMLFTDEQPNVGRTDASSFMGMAEEASRKGIGLTTIGVGVQFNGALATKVSSVRGGNLFFVDGPAKGGELMQKEFRNMVSEVAHDLVMTLAPHPGYKISGVFGVPGDMMSEGRDGAVAITVPSVFLSSNGGGIYASLAKADSRANLPAVKLDGQASLMDVRLSYVSALDGSKHSDAVSVGVPSATPHANLRLAQVLVDEYVSLNAATRAFHHDGDPKAAFALLDGLNNRLAAVDFADMKGELELVGTMRGKAALYAGYGGEALKHQAAVAAPGASARARPVDVVAAEDFEPDGRYGWKALKMARVLGKWRVVALSGVDELSYGDTVEFTDDQEFVT
ncbi:MAG: VWA domain-containing protein [Sphingopyxis sp.]|uniref:vWA domain-containing protein n=1 Tax=Sphingopyxis sp. TaxID=1908224 RepID=UPI002AB8136D|nr:VWA domain-containing protein [Sphingopyxis sp.]MDZ3831157.1 VWA domain-containing protein [Sphingopyxis sp.]